MQWRHSKTCHKCTGEDVTIINIFRSGLGTERSTNIPPFGLCTKCSALAWLDNLRTKVDSLVNKELLARIHGRTVTFSLLVFSRYRLNRGVPHVELLFES